MASTTELFTPPSDPSPNLRTFLAYFSAVNEWNPDKIMAVFDDTLVHHILPKSLGRPVRNKAQYSAYFREAMLMFKSFKATAHEVIEAGDKIVVHASSVGEGVSGTPYHNEYTLIFHFVPSSTGDGLPKISLMKEFVDSLFSAQWFKAEREKLAASKETAV